MNTPALPGKPRWLLGGIDEDDDRTWGSVCGIIAILCWLAAWGVKVWLANPACAPIGWSDSCIGWSGLWIVLALAGIYFAIGIALSRLIGALSDR